MIPAEAMTILATIGLTPDQANQVARAYLLVETATHDAIDAKMQEQHQRNSETIQAQRRQNSDRQARWRVKNKDGSVTLCDVIEPLRGVTDRDGPSRARVLCGEEVSIITPQKATPSSAPKTDRGHRLPQDWLPSNAHLAESQSLGLSQQQFDFIADEYRNFWWAIPGAKGRKLNWDITFTNRMRDQAPRHLARKNHELRSSGKGSLVSAGENLIGRLDDQAERNMRSTSGGTSGYDDVLLLPVIRGQ